MVRMVCAFICALSHLPSDECCRTIPRATSDEPSVLTALSAMEKQPDAGKSALLRPEAVAHVIAAASLILDVEALLMHLATLTHSKGNELPSSAIAAMTHDYLSAVLSVVLSFGTSEEIDRVCLDNLDIVPSNAICGLSR